MRFDLKQPNSSGKDEFQRVLIDLELLGKKADNKK